MHANPPRHRWLTGLIAAMLGGSAALAADAEMPAFDPEATKGWVRAQGATAARIGIDGVKDATAFAWDSYEDARNMVEGPRRPDTPALVNLLDLPCHELYHRRMALLPDTYDYAPAYWDDARNKAAVVIGTIITQGYYYLGYSMFTGYRDQLRKVSVEAELDALRAASAYKQCFLDQPR
jgi:opacity protein-like surface antigen